MGQIILHALTKQVTTRTACVLAQWKRYTRDTRALRRATRLIRRRKLASAVEMWLSSSIAKWIFEVHSHHAAVRQLSQGIRVGSDLAMEAALRWWRQAAVLYQYDVQLLSASIARLTSAQ